MAPPACIVHPQSELSVELPPSLPKVVSMEPDFNKEKRIHRSISFGDVQIREYPIVPGDNPAAPSGTPLAIDWEPQSESIVGLESYEQTRPGRRTKTEMLIPPAVREDMLRGSGYTRSDINRSLKQANLVRGDRKRTQATMRYSNLHEMSERIGRTMRNCFQRGRKKKEREYLQSFPDIQKTPPPSKRGSVSSCTMDCSVRTSITTLMNTESAPVASRTAPELSSAELSELDELDISHREVSSEEFSA